MLNQPRLFDRDSQDKALQEFDSLMKLREVVDWNAFRPLLESVFKRSGKAGRRGRPPWDLLVMFRVLILGVNYNLSDCQLQFQLLDRRSFKRFAGLRNDSEVPDEKTIWKYRDRLAKSGRCKELFDRFENQLRECGYAMTGGQIVDSTLVEVPRQRNTRDENAKVKEGDVPEEWKSDPRKLAQKDTDARWTKKRGVNHYGYKNHVSVDRKHKLIRNYQTSAASVHDSQELAKTLKPDGEDGRVWADSAYRSQALEEDLKAGGYRSRIHYKGYRNRPLAPLEKKLNHWRSKVRVRVEHVFGSMANDMRRGRMRCIGLQRADTWIGLSNLVYNMRRFAFLTLAPAHVGT